MTFSELIKLMEFLDQAFLRMADVYSSLDTSASEAWKYRHFFEHEMHCHEAACIVHSVILHHFA